MSIFLKNSIFTFILLLTSAIGFAADLSFTQCLDKFPNRTPPAPLSQEIAPRALCYDSFAILHSGKSRTPIFVTQRLNKTQVEAQIIRAESFFADTRLPNDERAELSDYENSGMDRGHMAPAGDMATAESMAQSFSLANIVPQAPVNNRKVWAKIEKDTRKYVMRAKDDVFVYTGPVFDNNPKVIGHNQVWVPRYLFKLVYDPSTKRAWAHWTENSDEARIEKPISYHELIRRTGIDFNIGDLSDSNS